MDGALCGVASVVSANVGVMEGIAGSFGVHCQSRGVVLGLPLLNQGMNGVNETVLWDRVEEAHKIIIGGVEGDVWRGVGEVAVKMGPQLWNGKLTWMLGEEVLQDNVQARLVMRRRVPLRD